DDSDFKSSIHDFVIAPTVEKQNKSPQAAEEIHNAWSSDEVRSNNLIALESEIDHVSQGTEKAFSYVDVFENKASDSVARHDGSEEGEEPSDAVQCLYGCDVVGISDSAGAKPSCDETMTEFKGSNIDPPYMVEDHIFCKEDEIPSLGVEDHIFCKEDEIPSLVKERPSTTPCVVEEFLSVCPVDEVRHNSLKPFESQIGHTSCGAVKLFSNVDTSENKACKTLVRYDVSEEGMKPYDDAQHLNRFDITGISDIACVKSICAENIRDFNGSSIDHSYTVEVDFSKGAGIPSLPKERASATPHAVEEILSGCSRDKVRTSNLIPCESEIHQTSHGVEKLFSHVDTFERKSSLSIGHHDDYEVDNETYDATQLSDGCDAIISEIAGVKPSCDETMLYFKGSNIDLPFTLVDTIVFKDADMLSLAKERASTTPHIVEEILSASSKDKLRVANLVSFDSEIHHTSQCGADAFENEALESLGHHDGSEEGEEPYDASYRFDVTSIGETVGANSPCDTMAEIEGFSFDLSHEEDNIVCEDADIPSLAKERAFVLEQLHQSMILLTPRSKASMINGLDIISDGFNSSPLGIFQNMDMGISLEHNNPDIKHFTASSSIMLMDGPAFENMFCNNESKLDGPGFESSHSLSSSSVRCGSELQNIPLTPPAIKFSHGRLSGKRSSSSVKVSSNTEYTCFRIDENSPTTEENVDVVQLGCSTHGTSTNIEVSTNSKPLSDVTSLYKNDTCFLSNLKEFVVRDSLESVNSDIASSLGFEYAGRESNMANKENPLYSNAIKELQKSTRTVSKMSSLGFEYAGRESNMANKENPLYSNAIKELQKSTRTVRKMSKRPRVSCRSSDRIKNCQNIRKGCKPSNILSSISSLIPLIQQKKQQALPLQRKKDIKVKALEAAEAAKRLEDQMKIEREKRKEAVKLEREKLKQENAKLLKLKQNKKDEERRKKEDVAAKKRQREAEERKVKDRKRQCIEETRTLQREGRDKLHCEKAEKDIQQKAMDEKQKGGKQGKNGGQKKLERGVNATESQMAEEMQYCTVQLANTETILGGDKSQALEASGEHKSFEKGVGRSNVLREIIEETVSATQTSLELQSYEMSPYQTSDDEDMEEDSRQKKYIPLWARGERLGEIILTNLQLDPKDIFSRKRSFNVSQVLTSGVLCRLPLK
ncbi:reticulocyte binding protein 2 homolog b, partial [Dendrobium catenatum]